MNLTGILRAILKRWWIPVLTVAVAAVAIYAVTPQVKAAQIQYTAKAILIVNPSSNQSSTVNLQEAAFETSVGDVPKAAAAALHYTGSPAALAAQVNPIADVTVGTLTMEVRGPNGAWDAAVANEFANALNQNLTATAVANYQAQGASIQSRLNALQAQVNQYQGKSDPISQAKLGSAEDQYRLAYDQFQQLAAQGQPSAPFNLLQKAVAVPSGGSHPPTSRKERAVIGGLVGLIIGLAIAVLFDMLSPRISDRTEAEREFGSVVLAEVPRLSRRLLQKRGRHSRSDDPAMSPFREAYRMLRTSILLLGAVDGEPESAQPGAAEVLVNGPQVILVSSPLPGDGKSTTVASLATSMAETGRRVLVCNADFRAPRVQEAFGLKPGPGLTDLLAADGKGRGKRLADLVHPTSIPGVSLVHSGTHVDNAAELVARRGGQLLEEARALADVVLLDTAPLLVVSDASELLPSVDAVIMVARMGQTTRDAARRSCELLHRAAIPVLGVVLVGTKSPMSSYYGDQYGQSGSAWRRWLTGRRRRGAMPTLAADTRRTVAGWPPATAPADDRPSPGDASDGASLVPGGNGARTRPGETVGPDR